MERLFGSNGSAIDLQITSKVPLNTVVAGTCAAFSQIVQQILNQAVTPAGDSCVPRWPVQDDKVEVIY